jgi:hypothetical protein
LFFSLIKSLNLAGSLQYLVVTSLTFQLLIINATTLTPSCNASLARAGAAGEQATYHHLGNDLTTASRAKLTRRSCIPQQASAGASAQS